MKKLTLTQRIVVLEHWADEMEDRILSQREQHLMDRVLRITDKRALTEADIRGIVYDVFTTTRKARLEDFFYRTLNRIGYVAATAVGIWGLWILGRLVLKVLE